MTQATSLDSKYGVQNQSDRAYETLRDAILEGALTPGDQLNERVIGEKFAIGRTPLRHAFARLTSEGLVEQIRHVGVFVRKLDVDDAVRLIEVRRAVESGAAAVVAQKANPHTIAQLRHLARAVDEAVEHVSDQELMHLEIQFHRRLIQCCDNSEMDRLHESIHALFLTLQIDGKTGRGRRTVSHLDLVETIATGDPVKAFAAMWRHMEGSAERWRAAGAE